MHENTSVSRLNSPRDSVGILDANLYADPDHGLKAGKKSIALKALFVIMTTRSQNTDGNSSTAVDNL